MTNTQLNPQTVERSVAEIIDAVESLNPTRIDAALSRIEAKDVSERDIEKIRGAYLAQNLDPFASPEGAQAALDKVSAWLPTKGIDQKIVTELSEALRLKSPKMIAQAMRNVPEDLTFTPDQFKGIEGMLAVFEQSIADLAEGPARDTRTIVAEKVRLYLDHQESPTR